MDITKINVTNLEDYTALSREMAIKYSKSSIKLNFSTVLTLDKLKSLEFEYFEKYHEGGAAFQIFENLLHFPPSTAWTFNIDNLLILLKFWFDKLKAKQHEEQAHHVGTFWRFLQSLLHFVKELRTKIHSVNFKVINLFGENLLQLVTSEKLALDQQQEVLRVFNVCCADSTKEARLMLKEKFGQYFVQLAHLMPSLGDFRMQFMVMETLLRWLVPRDDASLRKRTAPIWFPKHLYPTTTVQMFLEKQWQNLFKDARDFLNTLNQNNPSVVSLSCKTLSVGNVQLITARDEKYWLDFNIGNRCVTVMMTTKLRQSLKVKRIVSDALVVNEANTRSVKLIRNSKYNITIELSIIEPNLICDSEVLKNQYNVAIYMNAINLEKVDDSLRKIFQHKYEILSDEERNVNFKENSEIENSVDNSHLLSIQRKRRERIGVTPQKINTPNSPSITSTTLQISVNKQKHNGGCLMPQLSRGSEESEKNLSALPTISKIRSGVTYRNKTKRAEKAHGVHDPFDDSKGLPQNQEFSKDSIFNLFRNQESLQNVFIENAPLSHPMAQKTNVDNFDEQNNDQRGFLFNESDVVECLNDLVDKVCEDVNNCPNLMQKEFTNQLLVEAGLRMSNQTPSKPKEKQSKTIKITFPQLKKTVNMKRKKITQSEANDVKSPESEGEKSVARKRRKLYSPKDTHVMGAFIPETDDDNSHNMYRGVEEVRPMRARFNKRETTSKESPMFSSRAKKLDEAFDKLIQSSNENIVKTKNKKNIANIYDFPSNDDSDFGVEKPINISDIRGIFSKRPQRKRAQVNYLEHNETIDGNEESFIDEKMRRAAPDLDVSKDIERPKKISNDLMPDVAVLPTVEAVVKESQASKKVKTVRQKKQTKSTANSKSSPKKGKRARGKNSKRPKGNVENLPKDREESLSPTLACELQPPRKASYDSVEALEPNKVIDYTTAAAQLETIKDIEQIPVELNKSPVQTPLHHSDLDIIQPEEYKNINMSRWSPVVNIERLDATSLRGLSNFGSPQSGLQDKSSQRLVEKHLSVHDKAEFNSCQSEHSPQQKGPRAKKAKITPFQFKLRTVGTQDHSKTNTPRKDLSTQVSPKSKPISEAQSPCPTPPVKPPKSKQNNPNLSKTFASSNDMQKRALRPRATVAKKRLELPEDVKLAESREIPKRNSVSPLKRRAENRPSDPSSDSDAVSVTTARQMTRRGGDHCSESAESSNPDVESNENDQDVDSYASHAANVDDLEDMLRAVHDRIDAEKAATRRGVSDQFSRVGRAVARESAAARWRLRSLCDEVSAVVDSIRSRFSEAEQKSKNNEDRLLEYVENVSRVVASERTSRLEGVKLFLDAKIMEYKHK